MKVKAWLHPRGIVRITVSTTTPTGSWGKSMPLDDVPPQTVLNWLEDPTVHIDPQTRQVLRAYLWGYM